MSFVLVISSEMGIFVGLNFGVKAMRVVKFLKDWMLIISILSGIFGYLIYAAIPELNPTHHVVKSSVGIIQPVLIFAMLFLTFCKVNPRKLRLCRWHLWLMLVQAGLFTLLAGVVIFLLPDNSSRVVVEGAMLCLICPTATAGAVITKKLGGNVAHITTYTILINLVNALLIPLLVPLVYPNPEMTMATSSILILGKVFPLLLLPLFAAMLVRYLLPKLHFVLSHYHELAFYLWAVALALATGVTTHNIVRSNEPISIQLWLVVVSFVACVGQFYVGWAIGKRYDDRITAGQSLGQKNTVLAIWMGYTFFDPITSVVGGFYSIWHNVINSCQLYEYQKKHSKK